MSLLTECFSMYSDISTRIMFSSLSNSVSSAIGSLSAYQFCRKYTRSIVSSGIGGETMTVEREFEKLQLIVETAREVTERDRRRDKHHVELYQYRYLCGTGD